MKIAALTSSRADFGIYLPLLNALRNDPYFDVRLIVFGTHLSSFHGLTLKKIIDEGFRVDHSVDTVMASDSASAISTSMGLTALKFADVWANGNNDYDLVLCLGDRYEMFAAVSASVPYEIKFAHIHGGETTLGALDDRFRHCLSLFATLHFPSTEQYAQKIEQLVGRKEGIYTVGALGLDNLGSIELLDADRFREAFGIDMAKPSLLVTFHPETVGNVNNEQNARNLMEALTQLSDYQVIITMPNADTAGNVLRGVYSEYAERLSQIVLVESFGTEGYLSCMALCKILVGNSSSGIIEAASLAKYVVNVGGRQKGRAVSGNVLNCAANVFEILSACEVALAKGSFRGDNVYSQGGATHKIIDVLKNIKS